MKTRKIILATWLCATSFWAVTTAHAGVTVHLPAPPMPSISVDVHPDRPHRQYVPPPPPPRVYRRHYDRDPYYERDRHYRRDRHDRRYRDYDNDRRHHHRH